MRFHGDELAYSKAIDTKPGGNLVDILMTTAGGNRWALTDLLGRSLGYIEQNSPTEFVLHPKGKAVETMSGMKHMNFGSLDTALAEIERQTRSVCRRTNQA